jgi:hypothetical protein
MGERSFAQSGGTVEKNVIERITALTGSLDEHVQIFDNLFLSTELLQLPGSERFFHQDFLTGGRIVYESF